MHACWRLPDSEPWAIATIPGPDPRWRTPELTRVEYDLRIQLPRAELQVHTYILDNVLLGTGCKHMEVYDRFQMNLLYKCVVH